MAKWEVIVGNVGTVYYGDSEGEARGEYNAYVRVSRDGTGRAGGESVVLLHGDETVSEFTGNNNDN